MEFKTELCGYISILISSITFVSGQNVERVQRENAARNKCMTMTYFNKGTRRNEPCYHLCNKGGSTLDRCALDCHDFNECMDKLTEAESVQNAGHSIALSGGVIAGIVVSVVVPILLFIVIVILIKRHRGEKTKCQTESNEDRQNKALFTNKRDVQSVDDYAGPGVSFL